MVGPANSESIMAVSNNTQMRISVAGCLIEPRGTRNFPLKFLNEEVIMLIRTGQITLTPIPAVPAEFIEVNLEIEKSKKRNGPRILDI